MTADTNTPDILTRLNLDTAVNRVLRNIAFNSFPNRLDQAIGIQFRNDLSKRVETLLDDTTMDWANGSARFFDLPKPGGSVRPICYLDLDVAVSYQALVEAVGKVVEPYVSNEFGDRILSHRLQVDASPAMFRDHSEAYRTFIEIQHNSASSGNYSHCLKLDIANYYERIYHHKLQQLLERLQVPAVITTAVCKLLRKFANGDSHGIPQGLWASDYLGNVYLLYLDEFLRRKNVYFVRYVDDYRIFFDSEHEARLILKECCGVLREIGLNIQPLKTRLVTVDELDPELKPITAQFLALRTRKNKVIVRRFILDYFGEEYMTEDEEWEETPNETSLTGEDIQEFERLWTEAVDQEEKRASILSFALSGLSAGGSPTAEQFVLKNLGKFPNLALASVKYLIALGFKPETAERILDFIESKDSIHEWEQMWLLEYFRRTECNIDPYMSRLKSLLNDSNRHALVRALLSETLAFKGKDTDGEDVKRLFINETDPRIRRHLLLGFRLLTLTERNYAISYLSPSDWTLGLVGRLVKSEIKLLPVD